MLNKLLVSLIDSKDGDSVWVVFFLPTCASEIRSGPPSIYASTKGNVMQKAKVNTSVFTTLCNALKKRSIEITLSYSKSVSNEFHWSVWVSAIKILCCRIGMFVCVSLIFNALFLPRNGNPRRGLELHWCHVKVNMRTFLPTSPKIDCCICKSFDYDAATL